jgi:hypothetical protein
MTEKEVQAVAEELAKVGGTSWHPGREPGPLLRLMSQDNPGAALHDGSEHPHNPRSERSSSPGHERDLPPSGDRRAHPCRIVEICGDKAYLAPVVRTCVGWIAMEHLRPSQPEKVSGTE